MHATTTPLQRSIKRPLLALMLAGTGLAAQAASCPSTIFLSQATGTNPTQLQVSPATLPVAFQSAGTAGVSYNALGYNPLDDALYGVSDTTLVKVDQATGVTTSLGAITGLPTGPYNSGAFSDSGAYFVKPYGSNATLVKIDVTASPPTATTITLSQAFTTSDMAWVDGLMYSTADNGQLYSIDVTDGTTTAIGAPDATGGVLGAQFSGTNGLFGSANNGSGMYRINLTTGKRDKLSDSPSSSSNDGASCPNVALFEPLPEPPPEPAAVPTLDLAGLGLLSLLGAGVGGLALRRRQRAR